MASSVRLSWIGLLRQLSILLKRILYPALNNSSCLGIYTLNGWIADASEIEALFDIMDKMSQAQRE